MIKTLLAAVLCLLAARGALAQDQGFTADFGGMNQDGVPNEIYTQLLPSHVSYNTFPKGSVILQHEDFAFVAPRAGIVRFSGQIWLILDQRQSGPDATNFAVKITKNVDHPARPICAGEDVLTGIGESGSGLNWWRASIQVQGEDMAKAGDVYRWCIYATTGGGTGYVDGSPYHTRIHVSMSGEAGPPLAAR
jgi:hypothetical protein